MTTKRGRAPKIDWSSVDWTQPTSVLAARYGLNRTTITGRRKRHAPDTLGKMFAGRRHDWGSVDWSRGTSEIAAEMGLAPAQICTARKIHAHTTIRPCGRNNKSQRGTLTMVSIRLPVSMHDILNSLVASGRYSSQAAAVTAALTALNRKNDRDGIQCHEQT